MSHPATAAPHDLEFHYRLAGRVAGARPGAHAGTGLGGASDFVAHRRLFDHPDPRRLDLRASLTQQVLASDWLVRVHRQRAGITVQLLADVSASMRFGVGSTKLDRVADLAQALGHSAARLGDAVGLTPFDQRLRHDLLVPPSRHRGLAVQMAARLRSALPLPSRHAAGHDANEGLAEAIGHLPGRPSLVFLASDFHWPLQRLPALLDQLGDSHVVPIVVWDPAETTPPAGDGLAALTDAETGHRRTFWLRPWLRQRWREAVAERRETLWQLFTRRGLRPFEMGPHFEPQALSRHFIEGGA